VIAGEPETMDEAVELLEERGQPLEAEALVEAVKLHLDGAVSVRRGRTHLDGGAGNRVGLAGGEGDD
jgi:formyltetrahydrofolate deformylase